MAVLLPPQQQLRQPVASARPPRWAVELQPLVRAPAVVDSDRSLNPAEVEGLAQPQHLRREVLEDWVVAEASDLQHQHREALAVHLGLLDDKK